MMRRLAQRGFTLIEILIGLVIFAFLVMLAAPMYGEMLANTEVRNGAESVLNGLRKAQAAAVRYNTVSSFVLASDKWTVWVYLPEAPSSGDDGAPVDLVLADCQAIAAGARCPMAPYSFHEGAARATLSKTGTVTFNGLGQVIPNLDGSDTLDAVQVTTSAISNPRKLNVLVTKANSGAVMKMCDPSHASTDPMGCPT